MTTATTDTHAASRPPSPTRGLLHLLWRQPIWAVPFALFFGTLMGRGTWDGYLLAYEVSLVFAFAIGVGLWITEWFVVPRLVRENDDELRGSNWPIGLAYGVATMLASYLAATIVHFTLLPGMMGSARSVAVSGMFSLLFFGLFSAVNFARRFHAQAIERARAVEQIRGALVEAELRALRAQIQPHFLFNALNSIASLIRVNPEAAEDTTTRLAEIFRYTLRASDREHVRFGEELEFLRAYLGIERTRFGERLRVEERIEPGLESIPVPSLLLQPIVENAVRYAVAPRTEGGTVVLAAARSGDLLRVEIQDDGPGIDGATAPRGAGFGLHAVRERVRAAGPPHDLEIDSTPGRGTRVRITLPVAPAPARSASAKGVSS